MTREEAILYFEEWIKRDSKMDNVDRLENIEIYKRAIKALEQEPILDKIRAEVLEYIDDLDIATEICVIFDKYKVENELQKSEVEKCHK